jgi:hypothetical protein
MGTEMGICSVNADYGSNDDSDDDVQGDAGRAHDNEVDETQSVDDKDIVSHVFLPTNRRMVFFFPFTLLFNFFGLTERSYASTAVELAAVFHQPDFHDLIRQFLFCYVHHRR